MSKEEIILGRLSRLVPYQQPVSLLAENGVRQDLASVVSNPLEERLPEEEEQHQDLSQKLVTTVGNHSHEQDANIAFPRDVPEEERLPESPSPVVTNFLSNTLFVFNLLLSKSSVSKKNWFPRIL